LKKHSDDHVNTNQEVKSLLASSGLCLWNFTCPGLRASGLRWRLVQCYCIIYLSIFVFFRLHKTLPSQMTMTIY